MRMGLHILHMVRSSVSLRLGYETHFLAVYNCRTSNAWDTDLALTATYFPHCGLTFAVLFGCPLSIEEEVLRRLSFAMAEAAHPLLMPGIFTELERSRQVHIIEATIDELETRILQLDFQSSDMEQMPASEAETRNQEKRTAWLDTTYLRNTLISWNTQQAKICRHIDELSSKVFNSPSSKGPSACCDIDRDADLVIESNRNFKLDKTRPSEAPYDGTQFYEEEFDESRNAQKDKQQDRILTVQEEAEETKSRLRQTGQKIKDRIQGIIDEYDDKIRDCTMRVDGMAMTTQWASIPVQLAFSQEANLISLMEKRTCKLPWQPVETHGI
jgi:hypothetical protein